MILSKRTISLVVGLPDGQKVQRELKDANKKYGVNTDENLPVINGYTVSVPEDKLEQYVASLPAEATVMKNTPFVEAKTSPSTTHKGFDKAPLGISGEEPIGESKPPYSEDPKKVADQDYSSDDVRQQDNSPKVTHPLGWQEIRAQGLDGSGVTLAIIDSGLYPHPDFNNRLKAYKNFSWQGSAKASDDFGHGTHVAGIAAGGGSEFTGVAPNVDLVGARISNPAEAIKAIDWVITNKDTYNINVMNLSLGADTTLPGREDPFAQAAKRAIDAGIITVVAAGNEYKGDPNSSSITTPGILAEAITVGAYNDGHTPQLQDDSLWKKSSRGPTKPDGIAKPDLVAPGVGIWSTSAPNSDILRSRPTWESYHLDTGTSMAAPMVSGAVAVMLQVSPKLTQAAVQKILRETAIPLEGVDNMAQGAGRLNLAAAVQEAKNWPGNATA